MATKKVTVEVSAEGLSSVLKLAERLNNTLDQAEKPRKIRAASAALSASEPQNTGLTRGTAAGKGRGDARDFGRQAQGLGGLVHLYATFAANVYAVSAAFNALSKAADFTNMEKAADILSTKVGISISGLAKDMKSLTDGAISMTDALASASLASSAGLNTTQIKELTTVAKGASIALGRDMTDALQRVFRGTIKIEPELLDELGLMVKVDDANKAYAKTLNKTVSSLTDYERRQAFVNAVTTQGISKYKDLADQAANPFSKLLSGIQDLGTGILSTINVALGPFISLLSTSPTALLLGLGAIISLLLKQAVPAISSMRQAWAEQDKVAQNALSSQIKQIEERKKLIATEKAQQIAATQVDLTATTMALEGTLSDKLKGKKEFISSMRALTWMGLDDKQVEEARKQGNANIDKLLGELQKTLKQKQDKLAATQAARAGFIPTTDIYETDKQVQRAEAATKAIQDQIYAADTLARNQLEAKITASATSAKAIDELHKQDAALKKLATEELKYQKVAANRGALASAYEKGDLLGFRVGLRELDEQMAKVSTQNSALEQGFQRVKGTLGLVTISMSKLLATFSIWGAVAAIAIPVLSSLANWTGLTNDKLSKLTETTDKLVESFKLYSNIQEKLSTSGSLAETFTLQASAAQAYADALVLVLQKSKELGEFRDQKGFSGAIDKGTESLKAIFFNAGIWGQNANTGLATEFQRKMDSDVEFNKNNKDILGGKNAVQYIDSMALEDLRGRAVILQEMATALSDPKLEKSNREFAESSNAMKQNLKELSTISGEYLVTLQSQSKHLKALNALSSSTGNLFKQLSSKNGGIVNLSEFLSGITDQFQEMSETKLPDGLEKLKVSLAEVQKTAEATYKVDLEAAKGDKGLEALAAWNKSNTVNAESQRALEAAGYKKMQDAQIAAAKYTVTTSDRLAELAVATANATVASAGLAASLKKTQFIAGLSNRSGDISTAAQYDADRRRVQIENNAKQTNINSLTDQKNADINLLKKLLGVKDNNLNYKQLKDLSNRKIASPITDINTSGSIASSISRLAGIEGAINIASADIKVNTLSLPSNLQELIDVDFQAIEGLYNTQIDKNAMVFGKKTAELSKEFKGLIDIGANTIDSLYSYRQAILDNENELINQKANTKKLSDSLLVLEREFTTPIGQKNDSKNFDQETGDSAARALQQTSDKLSISSQAQKVLEESKIKLEQLEQQRLRNLAITQNEKLVDLVQEQVNLQSQYSDFLLRTTTNYPELNKLAKGQITSLLSQLDLEEKIARAKIDNQKLIISKAESLGIEASVTVSNNTDTENKIPELIVTTNSILGDIRTAVSSRKYATGGHVQGAGTATSDSIPAMLSNGEFVVNAASTKKFKPLLEKINDGKVEHLAEGGSPKVSLNRPGHEVWNTGYKYDPDKMYRVLGQEGLAHAKKTGKLLPKEGGRWALLTKDKLETYYNKGFAVQYSKDNLAPFIEVPSDERFIKFNSKKGGYRATVGEQNSVKLSDKGVKILQPTKLGGIDVLYDNTGWKYYGRKLTSMLSKLAAPLVLAETAYDTYNTPTGQYIERFGGAFKPESLAGETAIRTLGMASDLGDVMTMGLAERYLYNDGPKASLSSDIKDITGYNTGGKVVGKGTANSDSIPAMLSNGEFVVNAAATKKFKPLLEKINGDQVKHLAIGGPAADLNQAATTTIANANIEILREEQKLLNSKLRKMAEVTEILKQQNELTLKIIEQEGRWKDLFSGEGLTAALNIMADRIQETMNKSKSAMSQFATGLVDASDSIIDSFSEMIQKMDETKLTWVSFRDMVRNTLSDMFRNMGADLIKNGTKDLMMVGIAAARDKFAPTQASMLAKQEKGVTKEDGWGGFEAASNKVLTSEERAAQLLGINNTITETLNNTIKELISKIGNISTTGPQTVNTKDSYVLPTMETDSMLFGDLSQTAEKDLKSSVVMKDSAKVQESAIDKFMGSIDSFGQIENNLSNVIMQMAQGTSAKSIGNSLISTVLKSTIGSFAGTTSASMMNYQDNIFGGGSFAKGGIMSSLGEIPLHKYARGGIASSPQMALFGEGSKNEAYVPLPDNRSIPVTLSGGSGTSMGDVNISISINNSDSGTSTSIDVDQAKKMSSSMASSIKAVVQEELMKQMRPRGLLHG